MPKSPEFPYSSTVHAEQVPSIPLQCRQDAARLPCLTRADFHPQATIYRCLPSGQFEVVQIYVDEDVRPHHPHQLELMFPTNHQIGHETMSHLHSARMPY